MLPAHPLAQELELHQGAVIATFQKRRFIITNGGGLIPLSKGRP